MKTILARIAICILAVCLCLPFTACSQQDDGIPDGMQLATVAGSKYRLYVPTSWNLNTGSGVSGAYYLASGKSSLTVTTVASSAQTAEEFCRETLAAYRERFGEDHVKDGASEKSVLGGQEAVLYTFTVWNSDWEYRVLQTAAQYEGEFTLVTFAAIPDLYDACLDDVQKILSEFRFDEAYVPGKDGKTISSAPAPDGMKTASTDRVPYRFYIPDNWQIDWSNENTSAYFSETDRSNVLVTAYMPEAEITKLDDFYESTMKEYQSVLTDMEVIERKTVQMFENKGTEVWEFSGTIQGVRYHYRQTVVVYNSFFNSCFYVLTYTAQEDLYAAHLEEVLGMEGAWEFR